MHLVFDKEEKWEELRGLVRALKPTQIVLLCDRNTEVYCKAKFLEWSELSHDSIFTIAVSSGEQHKNFYSLMTCIDAMLCRGVDKASLLINLGGGMVSDLGGFLAAIYKRGIRNIHVPTTLLGMIDAAIGGKNGIDFQNFKNVVGTVRMPEAVIIEPRFLNTLPELELESGFGELVKHAFLEGGPLYSNIMSAKPGCWVDIECLSDIISSALMVKMSIVEQDMEDLSYRKVLNFGHTVGHALESHFLSFGSPILHGLAVVAGMWIELRYALVTDQVRGSEAITMQQLLHKLFQKVSFDEFQIDDIIDRMRFDKKNFSERIVLAVPPWIAKKHYLIQVDDITSMKKALIDYLNNESS